MDSLFFFIYLIHWIVNVAHVTCVTMEAVTIWQEFPQGLQLEGHPRSNYNQINKRIYLFTSIDLKWFKFDVLLTSPNRKAVFEFDEEEYKSLIFEIWAITLHTKTKPCGWMIHLFESGSKVLTRLNLNVKVNEKRKRS